MKKIRTREGHLTNELHEHVNSEFKGVLVEYTQLYYLDYAVDDKTYIVDRSRKEKFYTEGQVSKNLKAFKNAYYETLNKTRHHN